MVLQVIIPAQIEKRLPVYRFTLGGLLVQQLPPSLVFVDFILIRLEDIVDLLLGGLFRFRFGLYQPVLQFCISPEFSISGH